MKRVSESNKHLIGIDQAIDYLKTLGDKFWATCSSGSAGTGMRLATNMSIDDVYDLLSGSYKDNKNLNKLDHELRGWNLFDAAKLTNRSDVKALNNGIEYRGKRLKTNNTSSNSSVTFIYDIYVMNKNESKNKRVESVYGDAITNRREANRILSKYSNKQKNFVRKAYDDAIHTAYGELGDDSNSTYNSIKRDWASQAYEDEVFTDESMEEFDELFHAFELLGLEDSASFS